MSDPLAFLSRRQSVPTRQLGEPAPDDATLECLLAAAIRVPDHGKLTPWRLVILRGDAKREFGRRMAALAIANDPDMPESRKDKERERYAHAPLVIVVIARLDPASSIPEQEQLLSAGCVAYNLLLGAPALGFGAQWLTSWVAYDHEAAAVLHLADNECVVSFVNIGTPMREIPERARPAVADVVSTWAP